MGIDPNHHGLNHNLPRLQSHWATTSTSSSASNSRACQTVTYDNQAFNSDAVLEDDPPGLPDLNLGGLNFPTH